MYIPSFLRPHAPHTLTPSPERQRTAVHEAGHVIIGLERYGPSVVAYARIDDDYTGHAGVFLDHLDEEVLLLAITARTDCIIDLAGISAEEVICGIVERDASCESDVRRAWNSAYFHLSLTAEVPLDHEDPACRKMMFNDAHTLIKECHDDAKRIIEERRKAVKALARALAVEGYLGKRQIIEIWKAHRNTRPVSGC